MIRRRKTVRRQRERWLSGPLRPLARALDSQTAMAAALPRIDRAIDILELGPGRRYLDIGCGTGKFAHLLAARAALHEPPLCMDITPIVPPVDVVAWPEKLPFADASFDVITSFYLMRRFDDDVTHAFAEEISRVLAPGGAALMVEFAPVRNALLDRLHRRLVSGGVPEVDLRGWGRMAALLTECGFDAIDLVNLGPYALPPIPRVAVLMRHAPDGARP